MPDAAPIGREHELAELLDRARKATAGQGSIVFLAGPTGSGKSFLLKTFTEAIASAGLEPRPEVVTTLCYDTTPDNPLGPFGEILRALTNRDRRGDRAKEILGIVGDVAPPLIELIPVIGKLASVGVKAATAIGVHALGGDHEAAQAQLASDVALSLESISVKVPLVLVIDDAHWIDGPSSEVIARLAQDAEHHGLLLVIAYDPNLVTDRDLIARVRSNILTLPGVTRIGLADLDEAAIDALLAERYGITPEHLGAWLYERTDGNPLFLTQYLDALEDQGVLQKTESGWTLDGAVEGEPGEWRLSGRLAEAQAPDTLLELLGPRVGVLEDDERKLLETGAIQGRRFLSTVIVTLLEQEEDEIIDRLARIQERRRMIELEDTEDWWSDRSNLYAFDPAVLQELLYGRLAGSAYDRKRRHTAVAKALEQLIAGDDPPPRHALLEIARHYELAGTGVAAGTVLVEVARSTYAEGADTETASNAERAATLLRAALPKVPEPERAKANGVLAQAIVLLLLGGEPSWRAEDESGGDDLVALAAEGVAAADAAGDPTLRANARYAQALVLTGYRGLDEAVEAYKGARAVAEEGADPVTRLAILVNLGHQLDSVSLDEGWAVLQEAHALLTGGELAGSLDERTLAYETARLENTIGVAAFDRGDYGQALDLLGRSTDALRAAHRRGDLGWGLNFLGQLSIAMGLYEAAEATLKEAIALFPETETVALRGYLRALLGHLYLEWDPPRLDQARIELEGAREEVDAAVYRAVAPLVMCHWAELALAAGTPDGLAKADEQLADTDTYGWARSDITVASLRARIALAQGRVEDAVPLSTAAVEELERRGGAVPATRSEEILHAHALVLAAAGSAEAEAFARKAADFVRAKADSIPDPEQRRSFVERVRLSREILAAAPAQ